MLSVNCAGFKVPELCKINVTETKTSSCFVSLNELHEYFSLSWKFPEGISSFLELLVCLTRPHLNACFINLFPFHLSKEGIFKSTAGKDFWQIYLNGKEVGKN